MTVVIISNNHSFQAHAGKSALKHGKGHTSYHPSKRLAWQTTSSCSVKRIKIFIPCVENENFILLYCSLISSKKISIRLIAALIMPCVINFALF